MMNWDGTKGLAQIAERCYRSDMKAKEKKEHQKQAAFHSQEAMKYPAGSPERAFHTAKMVEHLNAHLKDVDPNRPPEKGSSLAVLHSMGKAEASKASAAAWKATKETITKPAFFAKGQGEKSLEAAKLHQEAAKVTTGEVSEKHSKAAAMHLEHASQHAAAAGGEWDEEKHPRDENGKFA